MPKLIPQFHRSVVDYSVPGHKRFDKIDAKKISGVWALAKCPDLGWGVFHVPSGMRYQGFKTLREASPHFDALAKEQPTWAYDAHGNEPSIEKIRLLAQWKTSKGL